MISVVPELASYLPARGSAFGGQAITLSGTAFPDSATQPHMTVVALPALDVGSSQATAVNGVSRSTVRAEPIAVMPRVRVRDTSTERVLSYAVDCRTSGATLGVPTAPTHLTRPFK